MPVFSSETVNNIEYSNSIYGGDGSLFGYLDNAMQISEDGNTIVVGDNNVGGNGVYVFSREGVGGGWKKTQTITWSQQNASSQFGVSVALSADANTLVVGSVSNSVNAAHGKAAVYTRNASTGLYSEYQNITVSTSYADAGHYVYISSDGSTIVFASQNETATQSTLYVYTYNISTTTWTQQTTIQSTFYPSLGSTLVISGDGNTIAAYRNEDNVVVYFRSGSTYTVQSTRTVGGATVSASGSAGTATVRTTVNPETQLSIDDLVIVSDIVPTNYRTPTTGSKVTNLTSAPTFTVSYASAGTGTQTVAGTVTAPSLRTLRPGTAGQYGTSMSISYDGDILAIAETDRVYLYTRSQLGNWSLTRTYIDFTGTSTSYGTNGALAISSDGSTLFVYDQYYFFSSNSSAMFVYSTTSTTLLFIYYLVTDAYNYSVSSAIKTSINGGTIIGNDSNNIMYAFDTGRYLDNNLYGHNGRNDTWTVSRFNELSAPKIIQSIPATSSFTFTVPAGAKAINVICIGGGGGGGGGARNSAATSGGGAGGGGGAISEYMFSAAALGGPGTQFSVTIGAGGNGAGTTTLATTAAVGNNGSAGGTTSFGSLLRAFGGPGGLGGLSSGGSRSGSSQASTAGMWVGATGGDASTSASSAVAGGGSGGGGGGGTGSPDATQGSRPSTINIALTAAGTDGAANIFSNNSPGIGGGGAAQSTTIPAVAGNGSDYGAGGGGGGEGSSGGASGRGGAGGNGAAGLCHITVWYG